MARTNPVARSTKRTVPAPPKVDDNQWDQDSPQRKQQLENVYKKRMQKQAQGKGAC